MFYNYGDVPTVEDVHFIITPAEVPGGYLGQLNINVLLSLTMKEKPEKCQLSITMKEMPISSIFMTKRCTIFTWINQ